MLKPKTGVQIALRALVLRLKIMAGLPQPNLAQKYLTQSYSRKSISCLIFMYPLITVLINQIVLIQLFDTDTLIKADIGNQLEF